MRHFDGFSNTVAIRLSHPTIEIEFEREQIYILPQNVITIVDIFHGLRQQQKRTNPTILPHFTQFDKLGSLLVSAQYKEVYVRLSFLKKQRSWRKPTLPKLTKISNKENVICLDSRVRGPRGQRGCQQKSFLKFKFCQHYLYLTVFENIQKYFVKLCFQVFSLV